MLPVSRPSSDMELSHVKLLQRVDWTTILTMGVKTLGLLLQSHIGFVENTLKTTTCYC